jgi:hypothetical protein
VCLRPKLAGSTNGVDPGILPPCGFIVDPVNLTMMAAAKRPAGAADRIRTYDPRITNAVLYRLSYRG